MIKVLVFSKDRPLQLQGYLDSLFVLGGVSVEKDSVTVLLNNMAEYEKVIASYKGISSLKWIDDEGNFDFALRTYVDSLDDKDIVLFGCDDVVYIRPVSLPTVETVLIGTQELLGFSLRLGKNIKDKPETYIEPSVFYSWKWPNQPSHWGYPFELMASAYRAPLIKEIVSTNKSQMQCPNHFESYGVTYCINNKREEQPVMTMFNTANYAVAQDVNRVQHHFQNKYDGTEEHDSDYLKTLHKEGKTLDWTNLFGIVPSDCFVGRSYWKVK